MINTTILSYKIETVIGEGGMGTVYLGNHMKLDRKVAIKVLLPEFANNTQIRDRFINEAKTLSKLNHQNIVTLYDFADQDNNLYLIMEYVDGTPLDTVIEKVTGPIPEVRCTAIFDQILSGFAYAHKKGIVHRDIKPSNIILQSDDTPKILDFGIAKIVEGELKLTKTGTRMGSVIYMSPEQVMGKEVDLRSDIYSLGVTLFEMLSGRLPYNTTTESEFEIQTKIVREPLPSIRAYIPNISDKLDQIICRATAKEPEYRFQNCEEFKDALSGSFSRISANTSNKTVIESPPMGGFSGATKTVVTGSPFVTQPVQNQMTSNPKSFPVKTIVIISSVLIVIVIAVIFLLNSGDNKIEVNKNITNLPAKNDGNTKDIKQSNQEEESMVRQSVLNWLDCWQSKDVDCYKSYISYDYQYESEGAKNKYQNYNERLSVIQKHFKERSYIKITASDIKVSFANDIATVSYMQTYNSDKYNDSGLKVLYLRKENNKWKIYKDSFY